MCFAFKDLKIRVLKSHSESMEKEVLNSKYQWNTTTLGIKNRPACRNKPYLSHTTKAFAMCILIYSGPPKLTKTPIKVFKLWQIKQIIDKH